MPERRIGPNDIAEDVRLLVKSMAGVKKSRASVRSTATSSGEDTPVVVGMFNPMSDIGDVIVGGESGSPRRIALGPDGFVLGIVSGNVAWVAGGGGPATGSLYRQYMVIDDGDGGFHIMNDGEGNPLFVLAETES